MDARELLKEARDELAKAHDHLMELTAKLPTQYFGLVDGDMIQSEDCTIAKIDTYLSAPDEDAMEVVLRIRSKYRGVYEYNNSEAAALIEGCGRRVPRAFAWDLIEEDGWKFGERSFNNAIIDKIAAKHGVVIE